MSTTISNSLLIFFLLCLSMHTCNARHLGVQKHLFSTKVLEGVKHKDRLISVHDNEEGIAFHESRAVEPKKSVDSHSLLREISVVPVPMKPLVSVSGRQRHVPRKNLDERRTDNFKPYSHVGLPRATSIEGSRRLSMVAVGHEHDNGSQSLVKQDMRDPHEAHHNDQLQEDASVTDYDPPHQKPPIHNRKT